MMYINVLIADNTFENALKTKDILREMGIIKNVWKRHHGIEPKNINIHAEIMKHWEPPKC